MDAGHEIGLWVIRLEGWSLCGICGKQIPTYGVGLTQTQGGVMALQSRHFLLWIDGVVLGRFQPTNVGWCCNGYFGRWDPFLVQDDATPCSIVGNGSIVQCVPSRSCRGRCRGRCRCGNIIIHHRRRRIQTTLSTSTTSTTR